MNLVLATLLLAAMQTSPEPATEHTERVGNWESLHYGMFVHFGLATMTFDEFGQKNTPTSAFNPTSLDVEQWARTARDAGMKYMVLTTKHCTGHCLWPSKLTDRSVANSPVKVDVVDKFVKACRKYKIKPGFYYLLGWDKYHQVKMDPAEYEKFCTGQIEELLTNYGPITELWLDIPWDMGPDTAGVLRRIYTRARQLQPECMVLMNQGFHDGSKVEVGQPSFRGVPVKGAALVPMWPNDILNGERTLPPKTVHDPRIRFEGRSYYLPHETCDTLTRDWFWREDDPMKPLRKLYKLYDLAQRRQSNLLLDVAPDITGKIRPEAVKRLKELAAAIDEQGKVPENLAAGKTVEASTTWHNEKQYAPGLLVDPANDTRPVRWAAEDADTHASLTVDFGEPTEFDSAYITEMWRRVKAFEIQVPDDSGGWKAIYKGTSLPVDGNIKFPMVTAKQVRFAVIDSTIGPSLTDFEFYKLGRSKKKS